MPSVKHVVSAKGLSSTSAASIKKAVISIFASAALFSSIGAGAQTLVVGENTNGNLDFYNAVTGALIHQVANVNQGGIALGADGYIYSEYGLGVGTSVIKKINKSDYSSTTFATGIDADINLHFDSHGTLWSASAAQDILSSIDSNGTVTQSSIFNHAFMSANNISFARWFSIDASDNFYFRKGAAGGGIDIAKYSSTGTLLNTFGNTANGWTDLEFDASGNAYSANAGGGFGVREYDTSGSLINSYSGLFGSLALNGSGGFYATHNNGASEIYSVTAGGQVSFITNSGGSSQIITFGSAVPEPGAIALGVGTISLGGLAFLRKRRHSRR